MTGEFLFEHQYRQRMWRFQPVEHRGQLRLHVWSWFRSSDGEWRPCKGSEVGCVIPLERIPELCEALEQFRAETQPEALRIAS